MASTSLRLFQAARTLNAGLLCRMASDRAAKDIRQPPSINQTPAPPHTILKPGFLFWSEQRASPIAIPRSQTYPSESSPSVLVLMFSWLFCKPKSASKYIRLYTSRGYDVLHIHSQLSHFLWPPNSKTFAREIGKVLETHFAGYSHVAVHAMSIGAYNYTTCMMLAKDVPELETYLFSKLQAVVYDSLTVGSLQHMMQGIAVGISRWTAVQNATVSLANIYFFLTSSTTKVAFEEGVQFFKQNPVRVPVLVFASENDPMSDATVIQAMVTDWKASSKFSVTLQIWERSGHCAHLIHHGKQYMSVLENFLCTSLPLAQGRNGCVKSKL